jgi:hypothetical protein
LDADVAGACANHHGGRERQAGASAELQAKVRFPTTQTYSMPQCKTRQWSLIRAAT